MKKILFLLILSIAFYLKAEAKLDLEKVRRNLIGKWQFYREYCYRPKVRGMTEKDDYYRLGRDRCVMNLVYEFKNDGTFQMFNINGEMANCYASSGYWTVFATKDAQGKEHAAIELKKSQTTSAFQSIMLIEIKRDYYISTFITGRTPDGSKVSDVWFNYYLRFPIPDDVQARYCKNDFQKKYGQDRRGVF